MKPASIAIFASGTGTNARRILEYFKDSPNISVSAVYVNKANAGVIDIAADYQVPAIIFSKESFYSPGSIVKQLLERGITHIVLAGFLWLLPKDLIAAYEGRIINIHPALLPKFGGKGMYGKHVHEAVKLAGETETGITIHLVNEHYDDGKYLVQQQVSLTGKETPEEIAMKVQELEHTYFPAVIENWINNCY